MTSTSTTDVASLKADLKALRRQRSSLEDQLKARKRELRTTEDVPQQESLRSAIGLIEEELHSTRGLIFDAAEAVDRETTADAEAHDTVTVRGYEYLLAQGIPREDIDLMLIGAYRDVRRDEPEL